MKEIVKEIKSYIVEDGKEFSSSVECEWHENILMSQRSGLTSEVKMQADGYA